MVDKHPSNVAKPYSGDRLDYLQMEIGLGRGNRGKRVCYLTLNTVEEDGELEIEEPLSSSQTPSGEICRGRYS